jgi:mannose-6-phosphate isomerase-like protein (cupin superfamily)
VKIQSKHLTVKNPPEHFTGDVWMDGLASPQDKGQHMVVAKVRFAPGGRTAWHSHALGQMLHVTEGVALMQARGGEILEVHPGRPSTPHPAKSTGTAPPLITSRNTSPCSRRVTTQPPPPPGLSKSLTRNTTAPNAKVFDLTLPLDQAEGYEAMDKRPAITVLLQPSGPSRNLP